MIKKVDVFVFYDCVQYDDRGWRNRNQIKTKDGMKWLTIPVNSRGAQTSGIPINMIPIVWESPWNKKHLAAICHSYARAPYFKQYMPLLEEYYARKDTLLADFTCAVTEALARALGICDTCFMRSSTLPAEGTKTDRLLSVLTHLGASHYISGPSASAYLEEEKLAEAGITTEYMNYDYPEYPQLHGAFEPKVSVLDLLLMAGPEAGRYIGAAIP